MKQKELDPADRETILHIQQRQDRLQDRQNRQEEFMHDVLEFFGLVAVRSPLTGRRHFRVREDKTLQRMLREAGRTHPDVEKPEEITFDELPPEQSGPGDNLP